MLPELMGFCRQVVTIAPRTGVDAYGQPTFGAAASYRARVEGRRRFVRSASGEEVLSTHTILLAGAPTIGMHDRLTLSTGDVNSTETGLRQPPILSVGVFPDDLGRRHVTVFL